MPYLPAATLRTMRALQESSMDSSCDLIGFADSRIAGGFTARTPILLATVKCRLQMTGAALPIVAEQPTPQAAYKLWLPDSTDITGARRATVSGVDVDGSTWSVELILGGVLNAATYSASLVIDCSLATDTLVPPAAVATVVVSEA